MKTMLLIRDSILTKFEDYRNSWEDEKSEFRTEFRGKCWVETVEKALDDLGKPFLSYIEEQGKTLNNIEQDELIRLISEYDLEKNEMLTTAFESKEEAEKELELVRKIIQAGYENFTLIWSNSTRAIYRHNDFLSVQFNGITFVPIREYTKYIRCYDSSNCEIGTIDDENWSIWFNKIKTLNDTTFDEIRSMIVKDCPNWDEL